MDIICSINGSNDNETFSEKYGFFLNYHYEGPFMDILNYLGKRKNHIPIFTKDSMVENVPLLLNSSLRLDCPFGSKEYILSIIADKCQL